MAGMASPCCIIMHGQQVCRISAAPCSLDLPRGIQGIKSGVVRGKVDGEQLGFSHAFAVPAGKSMPPHKE